MTNAICWNTGLRLTQPFSLSWMASLPQMDIRVCVSLSPHASFGPSAVRGLDRARESAHANTSTNAFTVKLYKLYSSIFISRRTDISYTGRLCQKKTTKLRLIPESESVMDSSSLMSWLSDALSFKMIRSS